MIKINDMFSITYDSNSYNVKKSELKTKQDKDGNEVEYVSETLSYFATLHDCCLFILDRIGAEENADGLKSLVETIERCKKEIIFAVTGKVI